MANMLKGNPVFFRPLTQGWRVIMRKAVTAHSCFLKLGLLIFLLAVFIPAAANTALASLPPYIKSIEYVEITLNGVTSASTNLNGLTTRS